MADDAAKQARRDVKGVSHACPLCGGAVTIQIEFNEGAARSFLEEMRRRGARVRIVPIESAEADLRDTKTWKRVQPVGLERKN